MMYGGMPYTGQAPVSNQGWGREGREGTSNLILEVVDGFLEVLVVGIGVDRGRGEAAVAQELLDNLEVHLPQVAGMDESAWLAPMSGDELDLPPGGKLRFADVSLCLGTDATPVLHPRLES
jgi:hypothetical protein